MNRIKSMLINAALCSALLMAAALSVQAQPASAQRVFDTPEAATLELMAAVKHNDEAMLLRIFGPRSQGLISTVDKAGDEARRTRFIQAAEEYRTLRRDDDERITLVVGAAAWPFPVPLVKDGAGWRFDTEAGADEIRNRRIGANELATIDTLRGLVDAQRQYAAQPRDGSNVRQFARKVRSSPGKKDGLYWDADPARGEEPSPVGPLIPDFAARERGAPFDGYHYRILTRQGAAAPGGRYSYVINGRMLAGYAAVAWPADYGETGLKTFVVNHYGDVYEKDLGPNTARVAAAMAEYNPDSNWKKVED